MINAHLTWVRWQRITSFILEVSDFNFDALKGSPYSSSPYSSSESLSVMLYIDIICVKCKLATVPFKKKKSYMINKNFKLVYAHEATKQGSILSLSNLNSLHFLWNERSEINFTMINWIINISYFIFGGMLTTTQGIQGTIKPPKYILNH